jgi:signal transduction histidine kinase
VERLAVQLHPPADEEHLKAPYRWREPMIAIYRWFTQSGRFGRALAPGEEGHTERAPMEVIFLRCLGLAYLVVFSYTTVSTHPHPGLHGKGVLILIMSILLIGAAIGTQPRAERPESSRIALLLVVTIASAVLAVAQPNGIWEAGPYFVGIVAAMRLERRRGVLMLSFSLAVLASISLIDGHGSSGVSILVGSVPWFLVIRLMRQAREQQIALLESQAAEARAAAVAERARLAREMHDVLAHSLSALALQLESTRLLARDRGVEEEVTRGLDQAHHLAVGGLEEARRAIATARGDELPGPERLGALAEAFGEQSALSVKVEVVGEPRELAPDARLAVYRTAQEALTNIRRHASAECVEVQLHYQPQITVLTVEDHVALGTPPPVKLEGAGSGYGLTGMRERAELLGGELLAEPTDDGFRVELRLPT